MSEIAPLTIKAYTDTDYRVYGASPFVLRVGVANELLAKLYKQYKADCGVFITAYNPLSQDIGGVANTARQADLANELKQRSLSFFDAIGKHPSEDWPEERSYFVLGLPLEAAKALGKKYGQNAIIWCGVDAIPELVLLR